MSVLPPSYPNPTLSRYPSYVSPMSILLSYLNPTPILHSPYLSLPQSCSILPHPKFKTLQKSYNKPPITFNVSYRARQKMCWSSIYSEGISRSFWVSSLDTVATCFCWSDKEAYLSMRCLRLAGKKHKKWNYLRRRWTVTATRKQSLYLHSS
jgi:hypothetical protein